MHNKKYKNRVQFLINRAKKLERIHRRWIRNRTLRNKRLVGLNHIQRDKIHTHDRFKDYTWLTPPKNFSLINNAEECVHFINKLEHCFNNRKKVFVNLSEVTFLGHGALIVLLSKILRFKANNIDFNGSMPVNPYCNALLRCSGFFKELYSKGYRSLDNYKHTQQNFFTHTKKTVDQALSYELIKSMSKLIWGVECRCPRLQEVFIELMQNTNNHASFEGHGKQHWWTTASYDKERQTGCFSFIDYGVGILSSLKEDASNKFFKPFKEFINLFKPQNNAETLKLIMQGELHKTASKKSYRGKGLPGIYKAYCTNKISHLVVITNDTLLNFDDGTFLNLKSSFSGTFVYWELTPSNHHIEQDGNLYS